MKIEITNQGKWTQSFTLKLGILAIMGLIFLIPLEMIKSVIMERQAMADRVRKEISDQWAGRQFLAGPVLNIPVRILPSEKEEKPRTVIWHIMPESLDIDGKISPEIRYRSIYQTVVYGSDLNISGEFIIPSGGIPQNAEMLLQEAYFTMGITDNRGLKGDVKMTVNNILLSAEPGVMDQDIFTSGISFRNPLPLNESRFTFNMDLSLRGSEGLFLTPAGRSSTARLVSSWTSPSFSGSFLPSERTVDDKGFIARWEITHLNRNFPQNWTGTAFNTGSSSFGVDLFLPVDHYQKSYRSARYGILFIALTFMVLIFLEITRKENIHIVNYFLVSLGLVLFFSLLNSLSEHTGFNMAYMISSAATVMLITFFTATLFRNRKTAVIVAAMLIILYVFIFILLTLNDYAYLAGNTGLFILLAVIMRLAGRMKILKGETDQGDI